MLLTAPPTHPPTHPLTPRQVVRQRDRQPAGPLGPPLCWPHHQRQRQQHHAPQGPGRGDGQRGADAHSGRHGAGVEGLHSQRHRGGWPHVHVGYGCCRAQSVQGMEGRGQRWCCCCAGLAWHCGVVCRHACRCIGRHRLAAWAGASRWCAPLHQPDSAWRHACNLHIRSACQLHNSALHQV
jgi:hypothetical protein